MFEKRNSSLIAIEVQHLVCTRIESYVVGWYKRAKAPIFDLFYMIVIPYATSFLLSYHLCMSATPGMHMLKTDCKLSQMPLKSTGLVIAKGNNYC